MSITAAQVIKASLENEYDIPFQVDYIPHYSDMWFSVRPAESDKELFEILLKFINQLRLTIEVQPEKYAASSINDMSIASEEKKRLFVQYVQQLIQRKAKIDFTINGYSVNVTEPDTWPENWRQYRIRISKSPICSEDEKFDAGNIGADWAVIVVGMILSLLDVVQLDNTIYVEGGVKRVEVNRYERNPLNRELCLIANGYKCKICGFDFEKCYGAIGHHFIHVHHIKPVSESNNKYEIDPVNDLIPVCPNCHAMLHRTDPPMNPEDLKKHLIIYSNSDNQK